MTNSTFSKAALAQVVMEHVPPLIRRTLLDDRAFREEYGIRTTAVISLGPRGVLVQRTKLLDTARSVLAGFDNAEIVDEADRVWQLKNEADDDSLPVLVLTTAGERLMLPNFAVLSEDITLRIRSLEESAKDVNLPNDAKERWVEILSGRPLDDDEIDLFHRDLCNTPVHLERTIRSEIGAGQSTIASLVPNSRDYYHRLVGSFDGSTSIRDYAVGSGRTFFDHLSEWRPYEGFLLSLLLSSHSTLTDEISIDRLDSDRLVQAYEFVEAHGDILSRLGAFEVGLRILPDRPEVEPFLLRLVQRVRDDDLDSDQSNFKIFSALFVLVDGELSRTRLMSDSPPFYRRLASLAQAALIHRQLVQSGVEYKSFSEWAFSSRFEYFYMQSLADMRAEPRWSPDLIDASQIKEDFFGRLMIAGNIFSLNMGEGELREAVLGSGEKGLATLSSFSARTIPGHLKVLKRVPLHYPKIWPSPLMNNLTQTRLMYPHSLHSLILLRFSR